MKQPYGYYGGKQRMASKIIPLMPKHTVYVEPFFGGGSIFWGKPWPDVKNTDHYREVINDMNSELINFMRCLQDKGSFEELQHRLMFTPYSEEEHTLAIKIYKNPVDYTKIDRAWAWFVNANCSFTNKINGGWGRTLFGRNQAATWVNKLDLHEFYGRLVSTHITHQDAVICLEQWNSPQSFAYIDPPYVGTEQGHYSGYSEQDLERLVEFLDKEWQGSFILSSYDTEIINSRGWEKIEIETTCSAKRRVGYDRSKACDESEQKRKRVECLWMRENTVPVRKELQKLYDEGKFDCFKGWEKK